ncbi:unnamed protein product [Plutella xylostella]|uniref:RNA-directed DNA polymerase n=1 Tax=Plutella xylostella TaxID=51655 RepID=A0A8S4GG23_PLUXY|nr:unnamed protein product [Plutella xylostella]
MPDTRKAGEDKSEGQRPNMGGLQEFRPSVDRWSTYVSRLKAWFDIQNVKKAQYSIYLVAVVGTETLDLIIDLCYPKEPEQVEFETIVSLVQDHLSPKRSVIAERFLIFRASRQNENQSVTEYLAQLKKLSKPCNFDAKNLNENLRDQFVFGLHSDRIRQRLLTESNLTFDSAIEMALSLEAAVRDSAAASSSGALGGRPGQPGDHVYAVERRARGGRWGGGGDGGGRRRGEAAPRAPRTAASRESRGAWRRRAPTSSARRCYRCGQDHMADKCPFMSVECYVCGDRGHIAKMCKYRKDATVHHVIGDDVEVYEEASASASDSEREVYQLSDSEADDDHWNIKVNINGKDLLMEGDTGSAVSIISLKTYNLYFKNYKLLPCTANLKMYSGQSVKPKGEFTCSVMFNGNRVDNLNLIVIDNCTSPSLLGRNWMRAFKIQFPCVNNLDKSSIAKGKVTNINKCNIREQLIQKFPNVFAPGIGAFNKGVIALELVEGAAPVWLRARSVPYALRPAVEAELARLQREGIISPVEWSEWGTPIVPVIKRSGEVRLCGDYKLTVNPVLVEDKYPIPRIEDVFMILQGGQCFSKIDLSRAYQQLLLNEKSKTYCTIVTHRGMFTYNRLPFGVKCAPSKFQRIMEKLFRIPYVAIYLDDVVITGDDDDDHLCRLMEVFRILSESGLRVEPKKCSFFNKSISYLGYVIDASGLRTEATKIDAINNTPAPGNIAELRAFLGLINYYGKFVKQKYEWSKECETAFKEIKKRLLNAPVLAHFDPELETVVTCDASPYGVSAVLAQRTREGAERPVLHASRTLSAAEKNYAQICREGLAVIFAVTKFHDYLYGRHFTLVTDCKPLASIFSENKGIPSMAASRLQRWAVILSAYDYKIKCISSKQNCVADSLSRIPVVEDIKHSRTESYLNFITTDSPIDHRAVAKSTAKDLLLQRVVHAIRTNWQYCTDTELKPFYSIKQYLSIEGGCLLYGHRVVVPRALRAAVLQRLHATHQGMVQMKALARGFVYWPGVDADIERECRACAACQSLRPASRAAPLHPWAWPQEPWFRLHSSARRADIASTNATGTEFANLSKILEELQKFRTDLNALRSDFTGFRSEIRELSSSLKSCCLRVDKVEDRMETLEKRMESFGEADIEEISKLKNTISTLENQINDREQQSLSNDIEISGIPEGSGENVIHIATLIASKLGMTLEERDVVHAYRKGTKREGKPSRPRTISVRFVRQNVRDKFLKNARVRRRTTTENMNLPGNTIYYLVLVDAHSKWLEAYRVKSTSAQSTIENLRNVFARLGFPREAVTDNGPPFGSTEFGNFMSSCGIKHILVSPYKPSSNGAAESAVKIIKTCLKKAIFERENLDLALDRYLLMYRSTPHSATGRSPAELLLGRELRTPLHLLRPSLADAVRERQRKQVELRGGHLRSFEVGDNVMFKAFQNNKSFWMNGVVSQRTGPVSYKIDVNGKIFRKHVDHIVRNDLNLGGILIDGEGRENNEFIEVCDVPSLAGPNMTSQSARVTPPPPERAAAATPEPIANNRPTRTRRPVNRYGYE